MGLRKNTEVNRVDSHDLRALDIHSLLTIEPHPDQATSRVSAGPASAGRLEIRLVRMCIYGEESMYVCCSQIMTIDSIHFGVLPEARPGCLLHDSGPSGGAAGC